MRTLNLSSADRLTRDDHARIAEALSLDTRVVRYPRQQNRTQYVIGRVTVAAFDTPKWRDIAGPGWQEQYTLPMAVTVPILWEPTLEHHALSVSYPVVSLLRQGGAKLGGVDIAVNDDTREQPSTHTHTTYEYAGAQQLAGRTLFGHAASLERGISVREVPYDHDPTKSRWVLDFRHDGF